VFNRYDAANMHSEKQICQRLNKQITRLDVAIKFFLPLAVAKFDNQSLWICGIPYGWLEKCT
jgi:hypothetical protein